MACPHVSGVVALALSYARKLGKTFTYDEFLAMIRQVEESTGMEICAEEYKRFEACDNPDLERFYRWKGNIGLTVEAPFSEATFGPGLKDTVAELFEKLTPLYEYFTQFAV